MQNFPSTFCVVYYPYFYNVPAICPRLPRGRGLQTPTLGSSEGSASDQSVQPETTLKIRQLPVSWTASDFVSFMGLNGMEGMFDFVYIPLDFTVGGNYRFGFVNCFTEEEMRYCFNKLDKLGLEPSLARVQGYTKNVEKLINSPINKRNPETNAPIKDREAGIPILFSKDKAGVVKRSPFPSPTKPVSNLKSKSTKSSASSQGRVYAGDSKKIFCGGFSSLPKVTQSDIKKALSIFGEVVYVKLKAGFAFVEFAKWESTVEALKFGKVRELTLIESGTGSSASVSIKPYYR